MPTASREKKVKAVLLLSGGLDSILAGKMLLEQGIEVLALNFTSPFCNCTPKSGGCSAAISAARQLDVHVKVSACDGRYLEMLKHPRFGRGAGMNPCIDCRIHIFSRAREYMLEQEADFIASGEVLGERPMSQRRNAISLIERESGLEGLLVRPLSAMHFEPSRAEKEGLVDRGKLLAIQGRSRKPQIELADQLGISDYPCPAGGCKLTETGFATKFAELLNKEPDFGLHEARLLSWGRHFRLSSDKKAIVGRDERENEALLRFARAGDSLLVPTTAPGPTTLICSSSERNDCIQAAGISAHYIKQPGDIEFSVINGAQDHGETFRISVPAFTDPQIDQFRIARETKSDTCIC